MRPTAQSELLEPDDDEPESDFDLDSDELDDESDDFEPLSPPEDDAFDEPFLA